MIIAHDINLSTHREETKILYNNYVNDKHDISPIVKEKEFHELLGDNDNEQLSDRGYEFKHMYITSDDTLSPGDWYYAKKNNSFYLIEDKNIGVETVSAKMFARAATNEGHKKIIATSNPDLNLPMISDEFISQFISNPRYKAMVKYVTQVKAQYSSYIYKDWTTVTEFVSQGLMGVDRRTIILIEDNEVVMHMEKESYTRADMIHALTYGHREAKIGRSHADTLVEYKENHL